MGGSRHDGRGRREAERGAATIVEFADLKCPFCQQQALTTQPELVKRLVRTGRANMQLRLVSVIDENTGTRDGHVARAVAYNLLGSDRLWSFSHVAFYNQGDEATEWATPGRLQRLATASGVRRPISTRETSTTRGLVRDAEALYEKLGSPGTPSIFVQPRGVSEFRPVADPNNVDGIAAAVADATKKATPAR